MGSSVLNIVNIFVFAELLKTSNTIMCTERLLEEDISQTGLTRDSPLR